MLLVVVEPLSSPALSKSPEKLTKSRVLSNTPSELSLMLWKKSHLPWLKTPVLTQLNM
jgi:hypothetical protein